MSVTVHISPLEDSRARMVIDGLQISPASRASTLGSSITFASVSASRLTDRLTSYDGNSSGISITGSLMVDATIHAIADSDDSIELAMEIILPDSGQTVSGSFSGKYDASATAIREVISQSDEGQGELEVWYDLNGRRVDPDNLRPGIYLRRSGSRTEKILIR